MGDYREKYRPQFHFSAPKGWLNDPNGLIFYKGKYHMFYQYNPHENVWGTPCWGHAISEDLVYWEHLPIALEPDELGSIFSGTIVVDWNNTSGLFKDTEGLVALFTHHAEDGTEYQSLAYSEDEGMTWTKYQRNPVLRGGEGPEWKDFRDPKVFWYTPNKCWVMILGGGRYRIYKSDNLINWKLCKEMTVFEEFPDLFPLDDRWVLNINGFRYYIGEFDGYEFLPTQPCRMADFGTSWRACYVFGNMPENDLVWIAWMQDSSKGPTDSWRCNMSVPRKIVIKQNGGESYIAQRPIAALEKLRRPLLKKEDLLLSECEFSNVHGLSLDIELELEFEDECVQGIRLFEKEEHYLEIGCNPKENMLYVNNLHAVAPEYAEITTMFYDRLNDRQNPKSVYSRIFSEYESIAGSLKLRILIDQSTVEVFFGDGKWVCSLSIYPDLAAEGMSLFGGKNTKVRKIEVYSMKSIWD